MGPAGRRVLAAALGPPNDRAGVLVRFSRGPSPAPWSAGAGRGQAVSPTSGTGQRAAGHGKRGPGCRGYGGAPRQWTAAVQHAGRARDGAGAPGRGASTTGHDAQSAASRTGQAGRAQLVPPAITANVVVSPGPWPGKLQPRQSCRSSASTGSASRGDVHFNVGASHGPLVHPVGTVRVWIRPTAAGGRQPVLHLQASASRPSCPFVEPAGLGAGALPATSEHNAARARHGHVPTDGLADQHPSLPYQLSVPGGGRARQL